MRKRLALALVVVPLLTLNLAGSGGDGRYYSTPNGLRCLDLEMGRGPTVRSGDVLEIEYTYWRHGNEKASFTARKVFRPGGGEEHGDFEEALTNIRVGGKRKIVFPGRNGDPKKGLPPTERHTKDVWVVGVYDRTPTGLLFLDVCDGRGETAKKGDILEAHYTGWLKDGKRFDSNRDCHPFVLTLGKGEVIKGWEEGLHGMKAGGRRKLIIPPHLAYGDKGAGAIIPPNAELTFEVELVKIR
jgi:FKBP-type peptidyl-prolyl cis-trans isomerase